MSRGSSYHHGDLRAELMRGALDVIGERGAAALSLRAVARQAGVTHAAATYHFGDKAGLFTALATDGYRLLGEGLVAARDAGLLEVGVAYVRFATTHPAHFEVMFRPDLYHRDDAALLEAKAATAALLYGSDQVDREQLVVGVAAWSIVHGLATLWLDGNLPADLGDDPEAITRLVASRLAVPRR